VAFGGWDDGLLGRWPILTLAEAFVAIALRRLGELAPREARLDVLVDEGIPDSPEKERDGRFNEGRETPENA
jgi:hypothetical protein